MKASEATNVVDINTARRSGKPRQKMPKVVDLAVNLIKAAEREALLKSLSVADPAVAEFLRVAAVAYDDAAKRVLVAFDEVTRKPSV